MNTEQIQSVVAVTPKWVKITKTYADFATAGLTRTISIFSVDAGDKAYLHDVYIVPTTEFSGGLIAAYTISIGTSTNNTKFLLASNIFTGNTTATSLHTLQPRIVDAESNGQFDITATAISTVGNLDAATAGSVDIYLLISTLP